MILLLYFLFPFQVLSGTAQGTTYTIKYVAPTERVTKAEADSLFRTIDRSLSLYDPASKISEFNAYGKVLMDEHMKNVVLFALDCYHQSGGGFDITAGSLSSIWGFGVNGKYAVPTGKQIRKAKSVTGSNLLIIKGDSLFAAVPGVKIDCNGIAQGYTVDVISSFLNAKGLTQFMVEVGGEIYVKGEHPETGFWNIGIESAEAAAGNWFPIQEYVKIKDKAITTSGISRKTFEVKGKRYAHIIDPKTGKPVDGNILSVTVIAENAMTADAWDNALLVMGIDIIKEFLLTKPDMQVWIVYRDRQGKLQTFTNIKK